MILEMHQWLPFMGVGAGKDVTTTVPRDFLGHLGALTRVVHMGVVDLKSSIIEGAVIIWQLRMSGVRTWLFSNFQNISATVIWQHFSSFLSFKLHFPAASMACGRFADSCGHQLSGHSRWGPKPRKLHKNFCQFRMLNEYRMHGCVLMSFCGNAEDVWIFFQIIQDTFSLPRWWQVRREESHRLVTGLTGSLTFARGVFLLHKGRYITLPRHFWCTSLPFFWSLFFKLPTGVIFRCAISAAWVGLQNLCSSSFARRGAGQVVSWLHGLTVRKKMEGGLHELNRDGIFQSVFLACHLLIVLKGKVE